MNSKSNLINWLANYETPFVEWDFYFWTLSLQTETNTNFSENMKILVLIPRQRDTVIAVSKPRVL